MGLGMAEPFIVADCGCRNAVGTLHVGFLLEKPEVALVKALELTGLLEA